MTIESISGDMNHDPIGAEFSPNLRKLEKIVGKENLELFAKLQWNKNDRITILKGMSHTQLL